MKNIINNLIEKHQTISTMESCTGGYLANLITNTPNSSLVFNFGAVTYSNDFKIKIGVDKELIDKYSVYSIEVAKDMSLKIAKYTKSTYGIGITGKLNKADPNNNYSDDDLVYISIYDSINDTYYYKEIKVIHENRELNKKQVCNEVISLLKEII